MLKKYTQIIEFRTNAVEKEFDVTDKSQAHIDRLESGILANLNLDAFTVQTIERDEPEEAK